MKRIGMVLLLIALCVASFPMGALAAPPAAPASAPKKVPTLPTTARLATAAQAALLDIRFNPDGTSTWRYQLSELAGAADLTSWILQLPACATQAAASPADGSVQTDAPSGLNGTKWTLAPAFQTGAFSVTVNGPVSLGVTNIATTSTATVVGTIAGPVCDAPFPHTTTLTDGVRVTLSGLDVASNNLITWRYTFEKLAATQIVSNWLLDLSRCKITSAAPAPFAIIKRDPATKLEGVQWPLAAGFSSGEFTVTLREPLAVGLTQVALGGPDVVFGALLGPVCSPKKEKDDAPPANIIIVPPATAPQIIVENNITFVVYVLEINNRGGDAKNVRLILDLGDDLDLGDLSFLERIGYVIEIKGRQVIIGLGENNELSGDAAVKLRFKFKVKGEGKREVTASFRYSISYGDSTGTQSTQPVVVNVTIPITVVAAPMVVAPQRLPVERIDVRFRVRWNNGGGLRIYGLPLGEPRTLPSGVIVQYFERARFEYHPENEGTPFVVLLGLLGSELGYAQPPVAPPTSTNTLEAAWYFVPTGHLIAPTFRTFWRERGGLLTFGYPIGAAFTTSDGLIVQYFERVKLEYHPKLANTEYSILLGFLGEEALLSSQR